MNTWNSPHLLSISWEMARVLLGGLEGTGATLGPASTPGCSSSCEDVDPKTTPVFVHLEYKTKHLTLYLLSYGRECWVQGGGDALLSALEGRKVQRWPSAGTRRNERRLHVHQPFYCVDLQFLLEKRKLILK